MANSVLVGETHTPPNKAHKIPSPGVSRLGTHVLVEALIVKSEFVKGPPDKGENAKITIPDT
jgi:hypothetical protein